MRSTCFNSDRNRPPETMEHTEDVTPTSAVFLLEQTPVRKNGLQYPYPLSQILLLIYCLGSPILAIVSVNTYFSLVILIFFVLAIGGLIYLMYLDPGEFQNSNEDGQLFCTVCKIIVHSDALHCKYCNKVR